MGSSGASGRLRCRRDWPMLSKLGCRVAVGAAGFAAQPQPPEQFFVPPTTRQDRRIKYAAARTIVTTTTISCESMERQPKPCQVQLRDKSPYLINEQRTNIGKHGHVDKREGWPTPAVRFPPDHRQGGDALAAQREK